MNDIEITDEQRADINEVRERIMAEGKEAFLAQHKGKIKEGSEDGEMALFLINFFSDAFWQGYLFATVEQVKQEEVDDDNQNDIHRS
jgi:hypothetical protein